MNPHSFDDLIKAWTPLTVALNRMNRTFGLNDCYPFVLTAAAIDNALGPQLDGGAACGPSNDQPVERKGAANARAVAG